MPMPSKYRAEFCKQAKRLCLLGATDQEMADFFEVAVTNLREWFNRHPQFGAAVRAGKMAADMNVATSLYRNAIRGNVMAQMYWLNNRRRLNWRQRQDIEVTGANGGPVEVTSLSRIQSARHVAFALAEGAELVKRTQQSGNAAGKKAPAKEKA